MSTIKSVYLQHLNGTTPNATMDTNGNFTVGGTVSGASSNMFRNRIINGDMRIDQRNAGAAVTTSGTFPVDRFADQITYGSLSLQQSSTAPAGFKTSVAVTVTTGGSIISSDRNALSQWIEGYNIADLGFGSATASSITLSFWVRSSLTGTFSGCVSNNVIDRSYVFTYSINLANTWEYKTITISGDTTGTWNNTNGQGLRVAFDLGTGTTRQSTAGSWQSGDYRAATGAVQLSNTTGATFYITGVQLEVGTKATPFEVRSYGHELALCQRYYEEFCFNSGSSAGTHYICPGGSFNANQGEGLLRFSVVKRAAATMSYTGTVDVRTSSVTKTGVTPLFDLATTYSVNIYTSTSGLTTNQYVFIMATNSSTKINASAEL